VYRILREIVFALLWESETEEIKKRGHMVVLTEDHGAPFESVQDGQPAGLDHASTRSS
jgi:hypothetical protein